MFYTDKIAARGSLEAEIVISICWDHPDKRGIRYLRQGCVKKSNAILIRVYRESSRALLPP